jgi:serine/threonine-protein kinase
MLPAGRLGRYEVLARLAAGGMGEIFLARLEGAAGFEKLCVIKRILPHLADDARFRSMMVLEAQVASKINHTNVCQIHELNELDGELYMVMEYLEGVTLLELIQRFARQKEPLELGLIAGVLIQAADGLHYAHELKDRDGKQLNIVHRDIAPSNIFLTNTGVIKILDFGIAKVANVRNTESGAIKGKYAYMSPEQLHGLAVDRRADVFALGIVLFEMLAQRRLFQRRTDYLTFQAVLNRPIPDVRQFRPDAPEALVDVMMTCLKGHAEQRYSTARQFRTALVAAMPAPPWGDHEIGDFLASHFSDDISKRSRALGSVLKSTVPTGQPVPTIGKTTATADTIDYFAPAVDEEEEPTNVTMDQPGGGPATINERPRSAPPSALRIPSLLWRGLALGALPLALILAMAFWPREHQAPKRAALPATSDPYVLAVREHQTALDRGLKDHGAKLPPYAKARVFIEPSGAPYQVEFDPPGAAEATLLSCLRDELVAVKFPAAATRKQILIALNVR